MREGLDRLKEKFDALTSREQWLIALAGWFAISGAGALVFIEPATKASWTYKRSSPAMSKIRSNC
ncbi:type II secretion system protein M [Enterovibrio coralii]|uniref:type II secretion system protein M n=1 Tax=Enterovibrio coralii TaxID=294935 RepID=UPI001E2A74DA|nr:type II secretion system protein M [Enterovibrio coralii]